MTHPTDPEMPSVLNVAITVNINGQVREFTAGATTASNPFDVADGLVTGLRGDAGRWLSSASLGYWKATR